MPASPRSRDLSTAPPPPMPSPQLIPAALPPPPPIPRRSSRSRLLPIRQDDPPIPPRLIGSPILHRLTTMPQTPYIMSEKAHSELWLDGDEFGAKRKETAHLRDIPLPSPLLAPPIPAPKRAHRTSPPMSPTSRRSGSRSPPPTPRLASPPPPVPPIPSSAFSTPGAKRSAVHLSAQSPSQIHIPELSLASAPPCSPSSTNTTPTTPYMRSPPPQPFDKQRCAPPVCGVTCLEFIALHNSTSPRRVAT